MHTTDQQGFLIALNTMGEFFCDELSELRQQSYWSLLQDRCTLDEWHYACTQAMTRELFHKMPLPAVLLDYVREYRQAQRETLQQLQAQRSASLALREDTYSQQQVKELIDSVWPDYGTNAIRRAPGDGWPIERKG